MRDAETSAPNDMTMTPASSEDAGNADPLTRGTPDSSVSVEDDAGGSGTTPDDTKLKPAALSCQNVPCPLITPGAEACCTTKADVDQHAARGADRCGVKLSSLMSSAFGDGCWQRDQLGIIDERCPALPAAKGGMSEPGCCADDGQCGTNNADQQLGCRHAPGTALRACGTEAPTTSCDPSGSYAVRVTVDSAWEGRDSGLLALTDDGRGPIQIYLLSNIEHVDSTTREVQANGRVCGITLPPFYSTTLCETYQPTFPDRIWESSKLPRPDMPGHYECGTQGCVLSLGPTTYLFGIRLDNPESVWPTPQQTQSLRCQNQPDHSCFPDDDDDGLPGVMVQLDTKGSNVRTQTGSCVSSGYRYRDAPLSASPAAIFNGVRRADRMLLGIRARVGVSVRFGDDCATGRGSAVAQYVNSRANGCLVEPGSFDFFGSQRPAGANDRCATDEADFIDQSMPEYHVLAAGETPMQTSQRKDNTKSAGPTVSVVRFPASNTPITCEQVRKAAF
jgi:hypothetical protein